LTDATVKPASSPKNVTAVRLTPTALSTQRIQRAMSSSSQSGIAFAFPARHTISHWTACAAFVSTPPAAFLSARAARLIGMCWKMPRRRLLFSPIVECGHEFAPKYFSVDAGYVSVSVVCRTPR
jgi:hypothetical protein